MNIVLVSKCSLDIEQHVEFKMSLLISPSKSLIISSRWVTHTSKLLLYNCSMKHACDGNRSSKQNKKQKQKQKQKQRKKKERKRYL